MTSSIEPITGRYVRLTVDGTPLRVYFEEAGQGRPVVCLHLSLIHISEPTRPY